MNKQVLSRGFLGLVAFGIAKITRGNYIIMQMLLSEIGAVCLSISLLYCNVPL